MYKKILVAVDTHETTIEVIKAARALANANQGELHFLHVLELPLAVYGEWPSNFSVDEYKKLTAARIEESLIAAGESVAEFDLIKGHPVQSTIEFAKKYSPDLIVVGSHSKKGLERLLGSTANGIIHQAKCDVLAVRMSE